MRALWLAVAAAGAAAASRARADGPADLLGEARVGARRARRESAISLSMTPPAPLGAPYPNYTALAWQTPLYDSITTPSSPSYPYTSYYSFTLTQRGVTQFKLIVSTQLNSPGDADAYVSDGSIPYPNITNATWYLESDFDEVLIITPPPAATPTYYIGISSFLGITPCLFTIYVGNVNDVMPLTDGLPFASVLTAGQSDRFTASFLTSSTYLLALSTRIGVATAYVNLNRGTTQPTPQAYDLVLTGLTGINALTISPADAAVVAQCPATGPTCALNIAVYSAAPFTDYLLTGANASVTRSLVHGAPLPGYLVNGATAQFAFKVDANVSWNVALTALAGGANVFVSSSAVPTAANSPWNGTAPFGDQFVSINVGDPGWLPPPAVYYIAIVPTTAANVTYTVAASFFYGNYTSILLNGIPQAGLAPSHNMTAYGFIMPNDTSTAVDVVIAPRAGQSTVYVSNLTYTAPGGWQVPIWPRAYCAYYGRYACLVWRVDPTTYTWSSPFGVTVPVASVSAPFFVASVFGATPDDGTGSAPSSAFQLTSTSTTAITQLPVGVPLNGLAAAGAAKFYRVDIQSPGSDLLIIGTITAGVFDIFASETVQRPLNTSGGNTWNTTTRGGFVRDKVLFIPAAQLSATCAARLAAGLPCSLFVAVYGWWNLPAGVVAQYTLTASYSGSPLYPTALEMGVPAASVAPPYGYQYFIANVAIAPYETIYVTIVNDAGGATEAWLNIGTNKTFATNTVNADFHSPDVGGYERVTVTPTDPRGLYCSQCTFWLTVRATPPNVASFRVLWSTGSTPTVLSDDQLVYGLAPASPIYSYYSYNVQNPRSQVSFTFNQLSYQITAWVIVQSPSSPYTMPSASNFTYRVAVWDGQNQLTIGPSDPLFCASADGLSRGAPCTYLIAVQSLAVGVSARFTVLATNDDGTPVVSIADSLPVSGEVGEGSYNYYAFTASPPGLPPPPVVITSFASYGRVELYVTNMYQPGVSSPNFLPSAGNPLVCMWVASNFTFFLNITSVDPCYNPLLNTYTIGVRGADGIAGLQSLYTLSASTTADRFLPLGQPWPQAFALANQMTYFAFELPDPAPDVVVAATNTYGQIALLVKRASYNDATQPWCYKAGSGQQMLCGNYMWFAGGVGRTPALYIPAASPCTPVTAVGAPAPVVNATCNATTSFGPGRYWAGIYGYTGLSEFSIAATAPGIPFALSDGQPQLGFTGPTTICPRSWLTGACIGDPSTWVNTTGAFFSMRVPSTVSTQLDQFALVERLCSNSGSSGDCGSPLWVFVTACQASLCAVADQYPYVGAPLSTLVLDVSSALRVPFDGCYPNGQPGSDDCIYYIGVYPRCTLSGAPGVGCAPTMLRTTFVGDTGVQRLPSDCFAANNTCTQPVQSTPTGIVRRFEAWTGDMGAVPAVVTVAPCAGDVTLTVCTPFSNSRCVPVTMPGPANYDYSAMSNINAVGTGNAAAFVGVVSSIAFFGINTSAPGGDGSFQLSIATQGAPTLQLPPSGASPVWSRLYPLNSVLQVSWQLPVINLPGEPLVPAYNSAMMVYALPRALALNGFHLDTPCGAAAAYASCQASGLTCFAIGPTAATTVTFRGLDPATAYNVAVVGTCAAETGCLPGGQAMQSVAYLPVVAYPAAPGTSPSPSPGASGGGAPPPASHAGAIAAGVVVSLVAVAAAVVGLIVWRRRAGGGGGSRYAGMSSSSAAAGGGGAAAYVPPAADDGPAYTSL